MTPNPAGLGLYLDGMSPSQLLPMGWAECGFVPVTDRAMAVLASGNPVSPENSTPLLRPPLRGWIEWGCGAPSADFIKCLSLGGLALHLSTKAAYEMDGAHLMVLSLRAHYALAEQDASRIELALTEGVANAVMHGNLEMGSELRERFDSFRQFRTLLSERLGDPVLAGRAVEILARRSGSRLTVTVKDQGRGYDFAAELAKERPLTAKSGRGLSLIRAMSDGVSGTDLGRCLTMHWDLA